ncbi:cytochrome P450 [Actinomadura madurae]|uniref:cytochrome P450 n=1 Tax=Actinomadura madurae TaxID=1993 RepID=UPI002026082F|nr:cytochrome P450 [Actinomadura madurae]MCP9954042.1 cytochrome P450 [Actinomadura madurae]MCP9983258.1 cytochrome P450 [Actinomadura madurae]MCQ0005184.1 cytochrome P450 [Actinomadura madurae]MCQ0019504.1 cytochrome P450 [Actinomadura madurae]URM99522.1 cytochrome P450 [Actinomadura madurae]
MASVLAPPPEGSDLKPVPGVPGVPYIGSTLAVMRDPIGIARKRYDEYGPVAWGWLLGQRTVTVHGPEAAETVLVNRDKAFANGPAWSYFIGPFFNRGIMLLDFEEHLHHRRIMQQAFTRPRLRAYMDAMAPGIVTGVESWEPGQGFKVYDHFKKLTLDLAADVFMGVELDAAERARVNGAFIDAVRAGTAYVRFPVPGLRWHRGLRARRVLEDFFRRHLPAKRRDGGDDLFAALCQAETDDGERFTDEDVVNHMIFALMAAHDTTTITLTTMAYYLAKYPEWQERLREESLALGAAPPGYDDLDAFTGIDMVMKESLRMVTPVPALPRKVVKDTSILGFHVPAGTTVVVPMLSNHHMAEWWPDPDRFDPGRFSPERREDKAHKYAWAPFGGGAHKCIGLYFAGMQVKTIMHQVLRRYRWSVPARYEWPLDTTSLPSPKDGLPVRLDRLESR